MLFLVLASNFLLCYVVILLGIYFQTHLTEHYIFNCQTYMSRKERNIGKISNEELDKEPRKPSAP